MSSHAHAEVTPPSQRTASRSLADSRSEWAAKDTCEFTCNSDTASCVSFRTCNTDTVSCTFELSEEDIAFIKRFLGDQPVTALLSIEESAAFEKNGIHKVMRRFLVQRDVGLVVRSPSEEMQRETLDAFSPELNLLPKEMAVLEAFVANSNSGDDDEC